MKSFLLIMLASLSFDLSASASKMKSLKNPFKGINASASGQALEIAFFGNLEGRVGKCGCAMNPKGGLDRRLNYIKRNPKASRWVFDTGNSLFSSPYLGLEDFQKEKEDVDKILKAHIAMGLKAMNVSNLDLAAGVDFLRLKSEKWKLPMVSSNIVDKKGALVFDAYKEFEIAGKAIKVFGLSSFGQIQKLGLKTIKPLAAMALHLKNYPLDQPAIVLSHMSLAENESLAKKFPNHKLIILGSKDLGSLAKAIQLESSVLMQGKNQGQDWAVVRSSVPAITSEFYSPKLAKHMSTRWDELVVEYKDYERHKDTPDRASEMKRIQKALESLYVYSPKATNNLFIYDYALVNMDEKYK